MRLAAKSDCPLLENRAYVAGNGTNANIVITGGIWDMDNQRQSPNPQQTPEGRKNFPTVHNPDFFFGMAWASPITFRRSRAAVSTTS